MRLIILSLITIISLSACREGSAGSDVKVISGEIGGKTYYVAEPYLVVASSKLSEDSIYIRALYPNFTPVDMSQIEVFQKGLQVRQVHFLARYSANLPNSQDLILKRISFFKAHKIVGSEFGLVHQTQIDGYNPDQDDIWLEKVNGKYLSYITCGEKILNTDTPQCTFNIYIDKFHIRTSFNKILLPHWFEIKKFTEKFYISSKSKKEAKSFFDNAVVKEK